MAKESVDHASVDARGQRRSFDAQKACVDGTHQAAGVIVKPEPPGGLCRATKGPDHE
jgi:hypothetical protein